VFLLGGDLCRGSNIGEGRLECGDLYVWTKMVQMDGWTFSYH
jgi:hypothetical protein